MKEQYIVYQGSAIDPQEVQKLLNDMYKDGYELKFIMESSSYPVYIFELREASNNE